MIEEKNNIEESLQNNNQEIEDNILPEPYQDNEESDLNNNPVPDENNIPGPYQNNIPGPLQNNIPGPYQNNIPGPYQNNIPGQYQNNIPGEYQNNIPGPYQNNIPGQYQNNIPGQYQNNIPEQYQNNYQGVFYNNFNQNPENKELNRKIKIYIIKFCIFMTLLFIAEIVLEFTALPSIRKAQKYDRGSFFYVSLEAIYLIFIYPFLILISLSVLLLSFIGYNPIPKIPITIILCIINGLIMINFFSEDSKKVARFGIGLEILNFFMMATGIIYQVILINLLNKYNK